MTKSTSKTELGVKQMKTLNRDASQATVGSIGTIGGQSSTMEGTNRQEALQNIIREKDKEVQQYVSVIANLKKENYKLKNKTSSANNQGFSKLEHLMQQLGTAEKLNEELKSEIAGYKRVQNEQSRALTKIVYENNYPQKIKGLVDELKYAKEKLKQADEDLKKERKLSA